MEEGLLRESLIDEAKPLRNGSSTTDMSKRSSKYSTTTAAVLFSALVAVCGSFCHGCASGYSSPAESGIVEDLGLSVATYSVFGSIVTVGGMIGAVFSGKIADIFGRKRIPAVVLGVLLIDKAGRRTLLLLLMGFGQSFAFLFGPLINWRILALIGIIPGLIQLPCLFFILESPRWLAKVGKMKEFEASLQSARGENFDISQEATEIKV